MNRNQEVVYISKGSLGELEDSVNNFLNDGYVLFGNVQFITIQTNVRTYSTEVEKIQFVQTLMKEHKKYSKGELDG